MISQYGVFFDKLADMFSHVRKTQAGKETMDHVGGEVETILKQERTYSFIKSILEAARKVLTSEVGIKNIFSVANFIQDELQVPKLFEMVRFVTLFKTSSPHFQGGLIPRCKVVSKEVQKPNFTEEQFEVIFTDFGYIKELDKNCLINSLNYNSLSPHPYSLEKYYKLKAQA